LPSLTSLYAICTALAQTLVSLQPEAGAKRAADIARVVEELS
jgi:hypothetical protein